MSATKRGSPRMVHDSYPTPQWATKRILEALAAHYSFDIAHASIIEPCCGDGAIVRTLRASGARGTIVGVDTRWDARPYALASGASQFVHGRAQYIAGTGYHLAITNPPFDQAQEIITSVLQRAPFVAVLLRSAFRLAPWRSNMPDEFKLPERPEFIASYRCKTIKPDGSRVDGCGWASKVPLTQRITQCPECNSPNLQRSTSDSSEYSWFVWHSRNRPYGTTRVLPSTPLEERKASELAP